MKRFNWAVFNNKKINKIIFHNSKYLMILFSFLISFLSVAEVKWQHDQEIIANLPYSTTLDYAHFGFSVAKYGEYVLVGSPGDRGRIRSSNGAGHGRAYLYKQLGDNWQKIATFTPNTDRVINFGLEVAISENTIAISAPSYDDGYGAWGSGGPTPKIFIYEKSGSEWSSSQPVNIITADYWDMASFGSSMSLSDDTLVVGADQYSFSLNNIYGAVYVYEKPDEGWSMLKGRSARLNPEKWTKNLKFGSSVKIQGNTIAVTAERTASVYLFEKQGDNWRDMTETQLFDVASDITGKEDYQVDMHADTLVISGGSKWSDSSGGAVIFEKIKEHWLKKQVIKPADTDDKLFGQNVAVWGDTLAITSENYVGNTLHIYKKVADEWALQTELPLNNDPDYIFSAGNRTLILQNDMVFYGLPFANDTAESAGKVNVYDVSPKIIGGPIAMLSPSSFTSYEFADFSQAMAVDGNTMVVGAPGEDGYRGAAYVMELVNEKWVHIAKITPPKTKAWGLFGVSVDIEGDTIVVGQPGKLDEGANARVYVYQKPVGGWLDMEPSYYIDQMQDDPNVRYENYGRTIKLQNKTLAVGAPQYHEGKVFLYNLEDYQAEHLQTIMGQSAYFGRTLAMDDDRLYVVANRDTIEIYKSVLDVWSLEATLSATPFEYENEVNFSDLEVNDNWVVAGSYHNYGQGRTRGTYLYRKSLSQWQDMTETQKVHDDTWAGPYGNAMTLEEDQLLVIQRNEILTYDLSSSTAIEISRRDFEYPRYERYSDYQNAFETIYNPLILKDKNLWVGKYWQDNENGIYAGKLHLYKEQLLATITMEDVTQNVTDNLLALTVSTNSNAAVNYEVIGGDEGVISIEGNVAHIHKPGAAQVEACVEDSENLGGNCDQAWITIKKGLAYIVMENRTQYVSDTSFTLTVNTNSNATVNFAVIGDDEGVLTIEGNVAHIHKAGIVQVKACVEDSSDWAANCDQAWITIKQGLSYISMEDVTHYITNNVLLLTANTNSQSTVIYEVVGGDEDVLTIDGNVAHIHKSGMVQVEACVEGTNDWTAKCTQAWVIIKGLATITMEDKTQYVSDNLLALTANTNSKANITYNAISGDEGVLIIDGNLAHIHKAGTVQVEACVSDFGDWAANCDQAWITIEKGLAYVNNFTDIILFKGGPPFDLAATTNSDGAIYYQPEIFLNNGSVDSGADLVENNQIHPNREGMLYLRATVDETENFQKGTNIIIITIIGY